MCKNVENFPQFFFPKEQNIMKESEDYFGIVRKKTFTKNRRYCCDISKLGKLC